MKKTIKKVPNKKRSATAGKPLPITDIDTFWAQVTRWSKQRGASPRYILTTRANVKAIRQWAREAPPGIGDVLPFDVNCMQMIAFEDVMLI